MSQETCPDSPLPPACGRPRGALLLPALIGGLTIGAASPAWADFPPPQIVAGGRHVLVLTPDGRLYGWGNNTLGQLAVGDTRDRHAPVRIGTDTDWRSISSRHSSVLALKADGRLYGWGYNLNGELGVGNLAGLTSPVQVGSDTDWAEAAIAFGYSLIRKADGRIYEAGFLRPGIRAYVHEQVGTDSDWASVEAMTAFAIKTDGSLYAWGYYNSYGQLGIGGTTGTSEPLRVRGTGWASVSAGDGYALGLRANGRLFGWGTNLYGPMGLGDAA